VTAQILIGTPGRFQDLMKKNAFDFKKIRIFVLDEADQMLDTQGLKEQTIRLVKYIFCPNCPFCSADKMKRSERE
jgi:ATP-dependent RNA helicase DDX19/DBP5